MKNKLNGYDKLRDGIMRRALADYENWYETNDYRITEVETYLRKFPSGEFAMTEIRKKVEENRKIKATKTMLRNLRKLNTDILKNNEKINNFHSQATNTSPSQSDGSARVSVSDKVGQASVNIADLKAENALKKKQILEMQKPLKKAINQLNDELFTIIMNEYYIKFTNWDTIFEIVKSKYDVKCNVDNVRINIKKSAVKALSEILFKEK